MLARSSSLLKTSLAGCRLESRALKAGNGPSKRAQKLVASSLRNRVLSVSTTLGLVPPRNALHFPSLSPLTTSRSYTRSLQPHSDASASTEAPTASNSKDPFASELRALMGSGDLDAALALLGSKRDGEFDYNDETMAAVTDLLASGAGLRLFSDLMIEFNWYSVQNGMPRHYLEALVKDLMAHGRMMEASEILNRRAMKVHRSLRDPNLTKIVIPTDVELYERFAEYQTDEIDVKWLLSSRFECALRNGETRIMLACSLPLAIRFPASMEYQVLYARSAHLCFRPSQQTQYGFDFDAGAFLLHMDPLPQLPSENIILRQYKMEAMIAIGKFDDAIAEFEMTSSPSTSHLVPWHIHATLAKEDKLKESTSEVLAHYKRAVASEAWNTVSTLERLQWARLLKASGSPSEALEIVEFLVNQGSSRHEFDDMLLFMFIMTDLPPLNARAVDLLESAARRSKAPALMHTVAHFYMAHPDMTERTTRLLDTALHYAPENILTRHLRAVIAEREERLEDALKINAIIYDEEPSILVASRVLRLHRKMGDFKKFMHFFNYLSDVKKRNALESAFADGDPRQKRYLLIDLELANFQAGSVDPDGHERPRTPAHLIDYDTAIVVARGVADKLTDTPRREIEARSVLAAALEAMGSKKEARKQREVIDELREQMKAESPF